MEILNIKSYKPPIKPNKLLLTKKANIKTISSNTKLSSKIVEVKNSSPLWHIRRRSINLLPSFYLIYSSQMLKVLICHQKIIKCKIIGQKSNKSIKDREVLRLR